jgi:hypothetical protein
LLESSVLDHDRKKENEGIRMRSLSLPVLVVLMLMLLRAVVVLGDLDVGLCCLCENCSGPVEDRGDDKRFNTNLVSLIRPRTHS